MELLKLLKSLVTPEPKPKPGPDPGLMTFRLSPIELARLKAFKDKHAESCPGITTIGGKFTYIFTPTGIGTAVVVRCNACGEEKDITDVDSW